LPIVSRLFFLLDNRTGTRRKRNFREVAAKICYTEDPVRRIRLHSRHPIKRGRFLPVVLLWLFPGVKFKLLTIHVLDEP